MKVIPVLSALLLSIYFLWGCGSLRNEVDPGALGAETAKLVVSSFLSPQDTLLTVKVARSRTVVGDSIGGLIDGDNIADATVILSEGGRSVRLRYESDGQPYYSISASQLSIVAGKTYSLSVQTTTGERATSSCTIPGPVSINTVTFDSLASGRSQRYFVRARWQDPIGLTNYYQTAGVFRFVLNCKSCAQDQPDQEEFSGLSFDDDNRGLFSDAGIDGSSMISGRAYLNGANLPTGDQPAGFFNQYKRAQATINLFSVDQAYYQYWSAVIRQRRTRGNPFAEPVLIPSNIQGGLGCFAGYNNATIVLRLK
ncbi:DUF4249 domain-containing protein [Spirosoma agri]|uniref:DUF4249 domain-containing protein n=1 Tax=Spirosoma agri TaxID=1987381 RepID=A0A6M0ILU3_9BACT|nr:DUF4249 domain-containing protein [Spirosoma agri]NEU68772.1 DUF4249 domain-containing protein [Spirosoma agri]